MTKLKAFFDGVVGRNRFDPLDRAVLKALMALSAVDGTVSADEIAFFREMAAKCSGFGGEAFEKLWNEAVRSAGYLLFQSNLLPPEGVAVAFVAEAEDGLVKELALEPSAERTRAFETLETMAGADGSFSPVERMCLDALVRRVREVREKALSERYPRGASFKSGLVGVALAALAVCGCSERNTFSDGRFVVGFDADFPPYGYREGDTYKGFDLDLARAVCEKKGWTFEACPINWDSKDLELGSGAIDCIWNGFTIEGREDAYTWSSPYVANAQVVLVKKGSPIRKIGDLAGKTVGVQTETPVEKALAGMTKDHADVAALGKGFKGLVVLPNYNEAVHELVAGALDAVVMDVGVAKRKAADMPGTFEILPESLMSENYGVGFKLGNIALRDAVDEALRELADDGTMKILAGRYGIDEDALVMWKD